MYWKRIEDLTSRILTELEIESVPIPINKIVRQKGLKLKSFNFGEVVSGALLIKDGKGTVGYDPEESKVRQRFTIAHELGHYILHGNLNETLFVDKKSRVHFRDQKSSTGESLQEQEANAFAASILMPEKMIKKELSKADNDLSDETQIELLANKFNVSTLAMTYRLANLRIF